jgi:enoyl-[acyl-carrier protein] reductase I
LDFDAQVAWPVYDWMGVAKAALEATARYPGARLGPRARTREPGVPPGRSARWPPAASRASATSPTRGPRQAPARWDVEDPAPVAETINFLLSTPRRAITAEIIHVDGGFHADGHADRARARGGRGMKPRSS